MECQQALFCPQSVTNTPNQGTERIYLPEKVQEQFWLIDMN